MPPLPAVRRAVRPARRLLRDVAVPVPLAGAVVPAVCLAVALAGFGVAPLGPGSLLVADLDSQYVQFFAALRRALLGGDSLAFSWHAGMGMNTMGVFGYYLASPFNVVLLVFDERRLLEGVLVLTLLKTAAAGLTMSQYLNRAVRCPPVASVALATAYALNAWSISYASNLMWLDGLYILPLLLLAVHRLVADGLSLLLGLGVAAALLANFYIAYPVLLFTGLTFLAQLVGLTDRSWSQRLRLLLRFASAAVAGAAVSLVLVLPTLAALSGRPVADPGPLPLLPDLDQVPQLLRRLLPGSYDSIKNGTANVSAGAAALVLASVYFASPRVPRRQRALDALLLLALSASLLSPWVTFAWQGFTEATWYPYRYSFLLPAHVVVLAARGVRELTAVRRSVVVVSVLAWTGLAVALSTGAAPPLPRHVAVRDALLLLVAGRVVLLLRSVARRPGRARVLVAPALLLVVGADTIVATSTLLDRQAGELDYTTAAEYRAGDDDHRRLVQSAQSSADGLFRVEVVRPRTHNDGMRYGYNAVSHYSSSSNALLHRTLAELGLNTRAGDLAVSYRGSTLATDAALGVRSVISDRPLQRLGQRQVEQLGEERRYENGEALPVGYVRPVVPDAPRGTPALLARQERLLGLPPGGLFGPAATRRSLTNAVEMPGGARQTDRRRPGELRFDVSVPAGRQLYALLPRVNSGRSVVQVEDRSAQGYPVRGNRGVLDVDVAGPATITATVRFFGTLRTGSHVWWLLDHDALAAQIARLRRSALHEVVVSPGGDVQGRVAVDAPGQLLLTVPWQRGLTASVNDRPAPLQRAEGAFTAVEVPAGVSTVHLSFRPPGLVPGVAGTVLGSLGLLRLAVLDRRARRRPRAPSAAAGGVLRVPEPPRKHRPAGQERHGDGSGGGDERRSSLVDL